MPAEATRLPGAGTEGVARATRKHTARQPGVLLFLYRAVAVVLVLFVVPSVLLPRLFELFEAARAPPRAPLKQAKRAERAEDPPIDSRVNHAVDSGVEFVEGYGSLDADFDDDDDDNHEHDDHVAPRASYADGTGGGIVLPTSDGGGSFEPPDRRAAGGGSIHPTPVDPVAPAAAAEPDIEAPPIILNSPQGVTTDYKLCKDSEIVVAPGASCTVRASAVPRLTSSESKAPRTPLSVEGGRSPIVYGGIVGRRALSHSSHFRRRALSDLTWDGGFFTHDSTRVRSTRRVFRRPSWPYRATAGRPGRCCTRCASRLTSICSTDGCGRRWTTSRSRFTYMISARFTYDGGHFSHTCRWTSSGFATRPRQRRPRWTSPFWSPSDSMAPSSLNLP